MKSLPIIAAVASLCVAACTTTERDEPSYASSETGKSCFWLSQVNGFNDAPDTTPVQDSIIVSVGASEKYLFETFGSCPDLSFSETLAFDQRGPGRICDGMDVDIIVPNAIGSGRCPVRMIRKLTKAEVDAM